VSSTKAIFWRGCTQQSRILGVLFHSHGLALIAPEFPRGLSAGLRPRIWLPSLRGKGFETPARSRDETQRLREPTQKRREMEYVRSETDPVFLWVLPEPYFPYLRFFSIFSIFYIILYAIFLFLLIFISIINRTK
jgi:hypothetical protein